MAARSALVNGRYMVISGDTHAGPSAPHDYAEYVDPRYREEFVGWADGYYDERSEVLGPQVAEPFVIEGNPRFTRLLNAMTRGGLGLPADTIYEFLDEKYFSQRPEVVEGTWNSAARVALAESDGIVGEVIHPDAVLGCLPPFANPAGVGSPGSRDLELQAAGRAAYNRWLADLCTDLPGRRAGIAMIGLHDIDQAVAEVRAARAMGLFGGVALSDTVAAGLPGYSDDRYEPLWAVCEELDVPINLHGGAGFPPDIAPTYGTDPVTLSLLLAAEAAIVWGKRHFWHLIASGALERHPELRVVLTEQHLGWVDPLMAELDLAFTQVWWAEPLYSKKCSLKPSEIWERQCFASGFSNRAEAQLYSTKPNCGKVMWGSDYPHPEGTHPHTKISLQQSFHGIDSDLVATMLGGNMLRAYTGWDEKALRAAAGKVGPTVDDLSGAPKPDEVSFWASRSPSFATV
jgi:predicted TIM-barrel fold metal-dependent hydrolase